MSYHSPRSMQRAFTLVQLVVVIGVLILLAALAFPVFSRVREKGRQTTCAGNLRQIYLAVQTYVQDYDGRFPRFDTWEADLTPYVKNSDVFLCPSQTHPHRSVFVEGAVFENEDYHLNYAQVNDLLTPQVRGLFVGGEMKIGGTHEAALEQTAQILLCWEIGHEGQVRQTAPSPACHDLTLTDGRPDPSSWWAPTMHSGGGNFIFLDGHTKWSGPEASADMVCQSFKSGHLAPLFRQPR